MELKLDNVHDAKEHKKKKTPAHRFKESEFEPKKGGVIFCNMIYHPPPLIHFGKLLKF